MDRGLISGAAGDWNEYALLVLTELKRLNAGQHEIAETLQEVLQQQAVDRQTNDDFRSHVERKHSDYDIVLHAPKTGIVPRVGAIEQREQIQNAIILDRKWILAGGFGIITALLLPLIDLAIRVAID